MSKMALFHPQDNANVGWGFIPEAAKYSLITCGWGEYIAHLFLVTLVDSTCFKSSRLWNGEVYPKYLTLGCMVNPIQPWMSCTSLACFRIEEHLPNCQVDYSYLQVPGAVSWQVLQMCYLRSNCPFLLFPRWSRWWWLLRANAIWTLRFIWVNSDIHQVVFSSFLKTPILWIC